MTYPRGLPPLLPAAGTRVAHPVRPEQLSRLTSSALTHAWARSPRMLTHTLDYDRDPPLTQQSPALVDQTIKVVWRTSAAAPRAYVAIRYQATVVSETGPAIDIDLRDRDDAGAVVDAGYTIEVPDLQWDPVSQPWNATPEWAIRYWETDLRDVRPGRRPFDLPSPGERRVELRLVTTNCRIVSVSVVELPEDVVPVES